MWNCSAGLMDVVSGSSAITVSNSHFAKHEYVMLFGAGNSDTQDAVMQITNTRTRDTGRCTPWAAGREHHQPGEPLHHAR